MDCFKRQEPIELNAVVFSSSTYPMARFIFAILALLSFGWTTPAAITIEPWVPLYKGIDYATGFADTNEVRLQRVFAFRVDLQDPAIEMFSTPAGGPLETIGQTTTTFVSTYGVKVGVNANFFSPVSTTPDDPRNLSGLALSQGQIVSPVETIRSMLLVTSNNVASIVDGSFSFDSTNYWTGVAGSHRVLINGVVQTFAESDFTIGNHPRTAVGISQNGRYLVMLVIDGRQPTWSIGAPLTDVGHWLVRFGCHQGLNLDGGGSTTMVKAQNSGATIVNRPSGGIQRVNGNHLGAFSQDIAPVFVNPPQNTTVLSGESATLTSLAGGTTPLRYQWQYAGGDIPGATNSTLTISNVTTANSGSYTLVVSNHVGVVSASAALNVNYQLFATASLGGKVTTSPNVPQHAPNSTVTLTALPDPGFVFSSWSGDVVSTDNPVSFSMTGHKTVTANFSGFPTDIIIDNPQATFSNTWSTGTSGAGRYGADYRIAVTSGTRTATYRPTIHTPGRYAVYVRYPIETGRATNAPWTVFFEGGSYLTRINQTINQAQWNLICPGRDFLAGTNGYVVLRNTNSAPVTADAVKFVYGFAPVISQEPEGRTVVAGEHVSFEVAATGTAPFAYQWFHNGNPLDAATNSSLAISNTVGSDAGAYSVLVTNLYGEAISSSAELVVNVPPTIAAQPASQSVAQASDITFSVIANGTMPFHYRWFFNGSPLATATGSSFSITNVQTSDAGNYSVRVTNIAGVVFSSNATLTVSPTPASPTVAAHPQSKTAIAGQTVILEARANGTLPLSYQWRFNGNDLPGEVEPTLVLPNVQPANTGNYSVRVSNQVGTTNSLAANLAVHFSLATVAELGGTVTKTPLQSSYAPGASVTLSASADPGFSFTGWSGSVSGTNNPVTFNIQSNSTVIALMAGAVSDIIMDNPAAVYSGDWTIGTSASGRYGVDYHFAGTSSSNATSTATYTANITTPGKYNVYVWYPQGSNRASNAPWSIVSENETRLTLVDQMTGGGSWKLISSAQEFTRGTNGYVWLGNNANNSVVIADAVRWSFVAPPKIIAGPSSQIVFYGSSASFSVAVDGNGPFSYQWFFNESAIPGAIGATYQLNSAQLLDSGHYSVVVSNLGGEVASAPAMLTVVPSPVRFETITISGNSLMLGLSSETTASFAIEGSTNLVDWTVLTNYFNQNGAIEFTDPSAASDQRFYRARILD